MKLSKSCICLIASAMSLIVQQASATEILCGSIDGEFHRCALNGADKMKVKMKHRVDGDCKFGQTWGVDGEGVWVDMGCRGVFRYAAPAIQHSGWRRLIPGWAR